MVRSFLTAFGLFAVADASCIGNLAPFIFQDAHDGDMKVVEASGFNFVIKPYNNDEDWAVEGVFDMNCVATVDFNVKGKPNPPSVPLKMSLWVTGSVDSSQTSLAFEFTDPSSTLAPAAEAVNLWVLDHWPQGGQLGSRFNDVHVTRKTCIYTPTFSSGVVVSDVHDGDKKNLKVSGDDLKITPYKNGESWIVKTKFDNNEDCVATIDFNVPGKPNPPPVPLEAKVWQMVSIADETNKEKTAMFFSDPSGTVAPANKVINTWVQSNEGRAPVPTPPAPTPSNHYEKPPCQDDEAQGNIVDSATGATIGSACTPECLAGLSCPADVPEGYSQLPQCALMDPDTGKQYCALSCHVDEDCPTETTCVAAGGLGMCVYPPLFTNGQTLSPMASTVTV